MKVEVDKEAGRNAGGDRIERAAEKEDTDDVEGEHAETEKDIEGPPRNRIGLFGHPSQEIADLGGDKRLSGPNGGGGEGVREELPTSSVGFSVTGFEYTRITCHLEMLVEGTFHIRGRLAVDLFDSRRIGEG